MFGKKEGKSSALCDLEKNTCSVKYFNNLLINFRLMQLEGKK